MAEPKSLRFNALSQSVPEGKLSALETRVRKYLSGPMTKHGKPPHTQLVNAIEKIRGAAFAELWTEETAPPAPEKATWLQIWLRNGAQTASATAKAFQAAAVQFGIQVETSYLSFPGRVVVAAWTTRKALEAHSDCWI